MAHVTVKPDTLQLNPTSATIKPGESVTFKASALSGHSIAVTQWNWTPNAGNGTKPNQKLTAIACGTATTCTFQAYEPGTLSVTATLNGSTASASAAVSVLPCPTTGDPRINDPSIRKAFADAIDAQPQHGARGVLVLQPGGRILPRDPVHQFGPTASYGPGFQSAPFRRVTFYDSADWHGHIHYYNSQLPISCWQNHMPGIQERVRASWMNLTTQLPMGDWAFEATLQHTGYLLDVNGYLFRWNNHLDLAMHSTQWQQDKKSVCMILAP